MKRRGRASGQREQGSSTVLVAGVAIAAIMLLIGISWLAQAALAGQRTRTAADLAALAAADAARGLSSGDPCGLAGRIAAEHGVELVSCRVLGQRQEIVEVYTALRLPGILGEATGRARAGPPGAAPGG